MSGSSPPAMTRPAIRLVIGWSFVAATATTLFILRFRARRKRARSSCTIVENCFIHAAYLGILTLYALQIYAAVLFSRAPSREEVEDMPPLGLEKSVAAVYMKTCLVIDLVNVFILWNIKAAFLSVQYEMCRALPPWHRGLVVLGSIYMAISFIICFAMDFVYCRSELALLWSYHEDYCSAWNSNTIVVMQYFLNIGSDVMILGLYVLIIRSLLIRGRQLFAFGFIFFLTFLMMTASTVSCINLVKINLEPGGTEATEETMENWKVWGMLEWAIAFIAVNLPALRACFREAPCSNSSNSNNVSRRNQDGFDSETGLNHRNGRLQELERRYAGEEDLEATRPDSEFHGHGDGENVSMVHLAIEKKR